MMIRNIQSGISGKKSEEMFTVSVRAEMAVLAKETNLFEIQLSLRLELEP